MGKIKRALRRSIGEITVRQLHTDDKFVGADEAFERPHGCWTKEQHNSYIESVFSNANGSPIMMTCNSTSRDLSQDLAETTSDAYFSARLKEGIKWTSIDGKHRRKSIMDFLKGNRTFSGLAIDTDGNTMALENCYFHKMPQKFREAFWEARIVRQTYTVLRHEMPTLFQGVNSGSPFTAQQYRNSIQTPIAAWTRGIVEAHREFFKPFMKARARAGMKPHELISKMYMHVAFSSAQKVERGELDKLYFDGECTTVFGTKYDDAARATVEEIVQVMHQISAAGDKPIKNAEVIPLFLAYHAVYTKNMVIEDEYTFRVAVLAKDDQLAKKSRQARAKAEKRSSNVEPSKYYEEWARLNWGVLRAKRQAGLWAEMSQNPIQFSIAEVTEGSSEEEDSEEEYEEAAAAK
tara:strand:+ start:188 stop:1405 length:1218 start_codon:yes stop_codon:yes gene_type:complete